MADKFTVEIDLDDRKATTKRSKFERDAKATGERAGKSIETGLQRAPVAAISSLSRQVIALGGTLVAVFAGRAIIEAAARQEDAVNKLNQALINASRFSIEASQSFQDFAAQQQVNTKIGDEQTLELLALAQTFARTNEEAQALVETALDLSAATGISLQSSVINLGKTFSGLTGELGEVTPQLRELTVEQLKAGDAIELLGKRFKGAAAAELRVFSGRLAQVINLFGDLLEEIGFIVTQSPQAVALLEKVGVALQGVIKELSALRQTTNVLTDFLTILIDFADGVNTFIILPIEAIVDAVNVVFKSLITSAQVFIAIFAEIISSTASFFAPESELAQNLATFAQSSAEIMNRFALETGQAIVGAFGFETTNTIDSFILKMREAVFETQNATGGINKSLAASGARIKKTITKVALDVTNIVRTGIVNTISAGIQTLGASLVTGGKSFGDFARAALGVMGDFAIQLGTMIITSALAVDALKKSLLTFGGPGLAIAAGIALIAVGGALKAFAGGPGVSAAGATAGIPTTAPAPLEPAPEIVTPEEEIDERPTVTVTQIIQGNILDRRETGLELAEILKETLQSNDIRLTS